MIQERRYVQLYDLKALIEGIKAHKRIIKSQRMYRKSSCFWYTRDTKVYSDLICVEEVYSDGENVSNCLFKCLSILSIHIYTRPHCWHIPHSLHISLHFSFPSLDTHTLNTYKFVPEYWIPSLLDVNHFWTGCWQRIARWQIRIKESFQ